MTATQIELPTAKEMDKKPDDFMVLVDKIQHLTPDAQAKVLENYKSFLAIRAKQAFDEAMFALKRNMPVIVKSKLAKIVSQKGDYSYHYPDLDRDVCDKLDPVLDAHGFGYRWTTRPSDKGVAVVCILYHVQGHAEETELPPAPHDSSGGKNACQAVGSTLTYMQRYSLLMALGIAPKNVDNDGAGATEPEIPKLDEWCTAIQDAHNYEEMQQVYQQAFSQASAAKSQKSKDALIAAREEWRKRQRARPK